MAYDEPLYRRPGGPSVGGYSTRILLGLLLSVAGVLLALHLPVSSPPARIGWSARPVEDIALTEVRREDPETAPAPPNEYEAPPPTQHDGPRPDGDGGDGTGTADESSTPTRSPEKKRSDPPVRSIATLSAEDEIPEIRGGMSAFYLNIQYPPAARRKGIEGRLELRFTVGADGTVRGIQVAKSLHPLCDSAAVRALRSVRFAPGTHNGEPIPVRMSLPVRFTLRTTPPSLTKTAPHTPSG
jgi:TonB family protein